MEYEIKYSARKTISLCIKDGRLIVKAPLGTPKKRISEIVNSHQGWIVKNLKKEKAKNDKFANLTDADIAKLKKTAKEIIPKKVEYYSKIMGLKYGRITITSAKTRFGSCSAKKNISFVASKYTNCKTIVLPLSSAVQMMIASSSYASLTSA